MTKAEKKAAFLAECAERAETRENAETVFVVQYEIQRHYGGAEEGGWWYDEWTLTTVLGEFPAGSEDPYLMADKLNRELAAELAEQLGLSMEERFSVAGMVDHRWVVDEELGEMELTETPRYE